MPKALMGWATLRLQLLGGGIDRWDHCALAGVMDAKRPQSHPRSTNLFVSNKLPEPAIDTTVEALRRDIASLTSVNVTKFDCVRALNLLTLI